MGQTIAEKIFAAHLRDTPTPENMVLDIDVIMCHEITTPIAIMDLMDKGGHRSCYPTQGLQDCYPGKDYAGMGPAAPDQGFL